MAKQTFTTGDVLTAMAMNNLQANDYNWSVNAQTASYVLVAADAGKRVEMNAAGATTITVNTSLFTAGDMVYISNIGAGTCTVTAGTATVNKATNASLALAQYQSGMLYFVSASAAIFYPFDIGSAGGTKNFSLLGTGTLTGAGATTVTVSGISGQDLLYVVIGGASSANASSTISLRLNTDTGANYEIAELYLSAAATYTPASIIQGSQSGAGADRIEVGAMSSNAASNLSGYVVISGCNSAGIKMVTYATGANQSSGANQVGRVGVGLWTGTASVTSVSLVSSTGNFDAGTFRVYGSA